MIIEVQGLRKNYNNTRALDGFALAVEAGETLGLVGPNGAGKTTLIKILATLLNPDGGAARIEGHDVCREPEKVRASVGYMPDVPGLYQDMRVEEFLDFFADAFRLKGQRKRAAVQHALERSKLGSRRSTPVEELSLGLKQKLVLVKTLLHEPRVLLLDEPATGLDPMARLELREQLKMLHREGVTILISSHILSDLEDICTRVALIDKGQNAGEVPAGAAAETGAAAPELLTCRIVVVGDAKPAAAAAEAFGGVRIVAAGENHLLVEVSGGAPQAAALLGHLVRAGVAVLRFDPRSPGLEERYRQAFEGGKR